MAKPLRSDDPNPKSVQFSHFGPLNDGARSKGATITSISINVAVLLAILVVGMMVKNNPAVARKVAELTLPPKPPEVPKPKPPPPPPPPKPLPKPPVIKELPKIEVVKIPPPPEIKPVVVPQPKPVVIQPPAPRKVDPPPAPKIVNLGVHAASIANNDAHPSAVRLGNTAIKALNGPAVATNVNLGGGMPGMNASNTGSGPHAASVNLGSGAPGGTNLNGRDRSPVKVAGLATGVPGGTGNGRNGPVAVQIAPQAVAVQQQRAAAIQSMAKPPVLIYKPSPVYTEAARAAHIEGTVQVRIRVTASGETQYLGLASHLGGGLDGSAETVARGMRFKPAQDTTGRPIDWTGDVLVRFQLS
jgi:protein TonB